MLNFVFKLKKQCFLSVSDVHFKAKSSYKANMLSLKKKIEYGYYIHETKAKRQIKTVKKISNEKQRQYL